MVKRVCRAALLLFSLMLVFCLSLPAEGQAASCPEPDTWSALQEALDHAPKGECVTLTHDLTAGPSDDVLVIAAGRNAVLDLNGHTLNRNLIRGGQQSPVLSIESGGVLTVRDSGEAPGVLTGGYYQNGGGIVNHGTLILEGGRITGNMAVQSGGGVANYDTMLLLGGEICGNDAGRDGGGIYNAGTVNLEEVTISGNKATAAGGGIYKNTYFSFIEMIPVLNQNHFAAVKGRLHAVPADLDDLIRHFGQLIRIKIDHFTARFFQVGNRARCRGKIALVEADKSGRFLLPDCLQLIQHIHLPQNNFSVIGRQPFEPFRNTKRILRLLQPKKNRKRNPERLAQLGHAGQVRPAPAGLPGADGILFHSDQGEMCFPSSDTSPPVL